MKLSFGAVLVLGVAAAAACTNPTLTGDPQIKTLYVLLPGNDTVKVDTRSGDVTPGPITLFGNADFSGEFFTEDGVPDARVTELDYRLDVTSNNTGLVTFARTTQFTGMLQRVAQGNTTIRFTLVRLSDAQIFFNLTVPIEVH